MFCLQTIAKRTLHSYTKSIKFNNNQRFVTTLNGIKAGERILRPNKLKAKSETFKFNGRDMLFAGLLTWLGFRKEEKEDELITVIKLGILSLRQEEYDKAETILHLALKLAQERQDMQGQRYVFDILANVAFQKRDFPKAEKLFIEVAKELLATGMATDDNAIIEISLKLASIYGQQNQTLKAEEGFKFCLTTQENKVKSIDLSDVESLTDVEINTVLLWGMSMDWYGKYLLSLGKLKDAKLNFEKALDISEKINGPGHPQTLVLINDLGSIASMLQDYDSAIEAFKKVILRADETENRDISSFYCNLGATYFRAGNHRKSEEACRKALRLAEKMNNTEAQLDAQECLIDIKNAKSQFQTKN